MPMNKAFVERLKPLKEKISVLLCVYKETGETKASIDVPFMNDKTGKAYSEDIIYNI